MTRDQFKELPGSRITLSLLAAIFMALLVVGSIGHIAETSAKAKDAAYAPINEQLAIRFAQGWTLHSAPDNNIPYRIIGAIQSDPSSGINVLAGGFQTAGRSVEFQIPIPDGQEVAVEGLAPKDGGPLCYAVLKRDIP